MYVGPLLAFAIGGRPSPVMVLEDVEQPKNVQFYLEESPEEETEVEDISRDTTEETEEAWGEINPRVFDNHRVEKINESVAPARTVEKKRNRYDRCQDNPGISQSGERYRVDRGVVDYYARPKRYNQLGHARWHEGAAGERDGFRLRRIHCDLHEAGMRNGDIVNSIDGRTVTTIREAIRLWFKVRRKNRVVLNITRKGQPLTLTYQLT